MFNTLCMTGQATYISQYIYMIHDSKTQIVLSPETWTSNTKQQESIKNPTWDNKKKYI